MSKTQLQTNNAKLEALITELQGKAAGGGEAGSCTVRVYSTKTTSPLYGYLVKKSTGEFESTFDPTATGAYDVTIQDVLCGSMLLLYMDNSWYPQVSSITGSAENICWGSDFGMSIWESGVYVIHITATDGETVTIRFSDDY